jgi:hypothetical protein
MATKKSVWIIFVISAVSAWVLGSHLQQTKLSRGQADLRESKGLKLEKRNISLLNQAKLDAGDMVKAP